MSWKSTFALAALGLVAGLAPAHADPTTLVFTTRSDLEISITFRAEPGGMLEKLQPVKTGSERIWTLALTGPPTRWLRQPSFIIHFPAREEGGGLEMDVDPIAVSLDFELRAMLENAEYRIPITPIDSLGAAAFDRVEGMRSSQNFEKLIMIAQFAGHYVRGGSNKKRFGARIARAWFATQWRGVMLPDSPDERLPLRLDSDLLDTLHLALGEDDPAWADINARIREWQTVFWDIPRGDFVDVVGQNRCDIAPLVVRYVAERHRKDEEAQGLRGIDADDQLSAMEQEVRPCLENRVATSDPN